MAEITVTKTVDISNVEIQVEFDDDDMEEYVSTLTNSQKKSLARELFFDSVDEMETENVIQFLERIPSGDTVDLFKQYVGMCDDESTVRSIMEFAMNQLDVIENDKAEAAKAAELKQNIAMIEEQLNEAKRLADEHLAQRLQIQINP